MTLDTRKLVGEQSLRGMIPPKAAGDILDGIDRMDLLVTFVAVNKDAFGSKTHHVEGSFPVTGTMEKGN